MKKMLKHISILLVAALLFGSAASSASAYTNLDSSSAFAGASLALAHYFNTNEDGMTLLADALSKVSESNEIADEKNNQGKVSDERLVYTEAKQGTVCTEGALNIRKHTSTLSEVVAQIYEGACVSVLGEIIENGVLWYYVDYEELNGYVFGKYVLFGEDVDLWYQELHEKKKAEAVLPAEFCIESSLDGMAEEVQSKVISAAKTVNYCLKEDLPKAIADQSYMNEYSILVYILENLQIILDYSYAYSFTEVYDQAFSVVETVNLVRERLTDETGTTDEDYDEQIQKAVSDRLRKDESYQGSKIALYAETFVGWLPYVWGGSSLETGADCSGFCAQIYAHFGYIDANKAKYHTLDSTALRSVGREVSISEILPGDLVCYNGHVAIYYGNGLVIHEPSPGKVCNYGNINMAPIITIRRLVTTE